MATFDPECITFSQMNLIFNARLYYRRLTAWTRAYLMSRYFGIGTTEAQFERLYQETIDIGDMLQIIFGRQASEQYSQMASQYAILFHQILDAQLAGDTDAVRENVNRLYENVQQRAAFLESINPYWSAAGYQELFNTYIQYAIETANAITARDFGREIELYDIMNNHTNRMGDVFARGVYSYIISGGSVQNEDNVPCITYEQMNDIYNVRMLWFELATWVRNYMLGRYTGVGDPELAYARLQQVPVDYINALKKFFPNMDAETYLQLFNDYIELIAAFVTAMQEDNADELNRVTRALYDNADARAAFITSLYPARGEEWARNILYDNIRTTIEESISFLTGDYAKNIDIFTWLLDQAETTSTFFAEALFNTLTQNQQAEQ